MYVLSGHYKVRKRWRVAPLPQQRWKLNLSPPEPSEERWDHQKEKGFGDGTGQKPPTILLSTAGCGADAVAQFWGARPTGLAGTSRA